MRLYALAPPIDTSTTERRAMMALALHMAGFNVELCRMRATGGKPGV